MSDRVTNAEVEDVLSSIRRLVSEDKRPQASLKQEPVRDRLVLTPSLRVAQSEPARSAAGAEAEAPPKPAESPFISLRKRHEELVPDEEPDAHAAEETAEAEEATDAGEDRGSDISEWYDHLLDEEPEAEFEAEASDDAEAAAADEGGAGESDDDSAAAETVEIHDDETVEIHDGDAGEDAQVSEGEMPLEAEPEAAAPEEDAGHVEAAATGLPMSPARVVDLSVKIAALETAIGRIPDRWEPDEPGSDDYSGTAAPRMDWRGQPDLGATGEPLPAREQPGAAAVAPSKADDRDILAGEEQLIDEEMLRDLVAEIVRSELQGALGERITRNVRKLVRREIHRALAAQELE